MPSPKPGSLDSGVNLQSLKLGAAAPTAPYVLTGVVPIAPEDFSQYLAVRKAESGGVPTDWFYTEATRIARIHGINYYEIKAYIDSGVATTFTIDRLDGPMLSIVNYNATTHDATQASRPGILINTAAWQTLMSGTLFLEFVSPSGPGMPTGRRDRVNLCGGYGQIGAIEPEEAGDEFRMWRLPEINNGWYRRGRIMQTWYKHVAVRSGGAMGYLHIFATIFADTPEIHFEINWHNAGLEERRPNSPWAGGGFESGEELIPPSPDDRQVSSAPYGVSRVEDILFHSIRLVGLGENPPAPGHTAWTWTPQLKDGANVSDSMMRVAQNEICKPLSDNDPNRVHGFPITFERPFGFAVHAGDVTPYLKHAYGVADWSKSVGGWHFTPLGLPDLTAVGADIAGMSLAAEDTTSKVALRTLEPWKGDELGTQQGIVSSDPFWPGSWDVYGGSTAGTGMTPFVGAKQAWTGNGLDILRCHALRDRARTYGALYYNISGIPVVAQNHAAGGNDAPWDRFDRRFLRSSGQPQDLPFLATRIFPRKMHQADYNPGPRGGNTPTDAQSEPTINRPDWYSPGEGQPPLTLNTLPAGSIIPLANFSQALGYTPPPGDLAIIPGANTPDLAVPVLFQINAPGNTWQATKSITFEIIGTGEFDVEVTEQVVFTGRGNGNTDPFNINHTPNVQAKASLGKFKNVREISIVSVTGVPVVTELITIGRQSTGIADYWGFDGITAIDDQHSVRYHAALKALYLLTNNPIAFVYLMMDGSDARMSYWEGTGRARAIFPFENGAPGRGNTMARNWAFAADRIATAIAISHSIAHPVTVDFFWDRWRREFRTNILNSAMSANGLFQAPFGFKETGFPPFGGESFDFDSGNDAKFMHVIATRETSYFAYALLMMGYTYGHFDQGILDVCKSMARGFQDLLWKTQGGTARGPHSYQAVAIRRDGTQQTRNPRTNALENRIKMSTELPLASDIWTIYPNQAGLPTENPLSKVPFNPAVYPTPSVDRFVTAVAGNDAKFGGGSPSGAMSALTIANAAADASSTPVPLTIRVAGGTTFNSTKRRTFLFTGTDPWGVPIDDDCLGAERAGDTLVVGGTVTVLAHSFPVAGRIGVTVLGGTTFTGSKRVTVRFAGTRIDGASFTEDIVCSGQGTPKQFFRSSNFFKTVTSITITAIQGTLLSTEKFRFGTRQTELLVNGSGLATQDHRCWQYFKTVTEVIMLTNAQAVERGFSNLGTLLVGETFALGFQNVGLRQAVPGGGPLDGDAFQTGYALACWKFLGATEADELIKRYCNVDDSQGGADTLAAAKAVLLDTSEYGTGATAPAGQHAASSAPYCQWAPLLQMIKDA